MQEIKIFDDTYEIIEEEKDAVDIITIQDKLTDYFEDFDYIVGDWAYGKLRLKGFNDKSNEKYNLINDIDNVHEYINKYCAYGCRYFILKKKKN